MGRIFAFIKKIYKAVTLASLLQIILFIPLFFTRFAEGSFIPTISQIPKDLVSRPNPDIFRWCLELGFLLSIYVWLQKKKIYKWYSQLFTVPYLVLFVFQLYYFILWKIYGEIPIFSYDWALFERVLPVFMKTMGIPTVIFYGLIILLGLILASLFNQIFRLLSKIATGWRSLDKVNFSLIVFIFPLILKLTVEEEIESNKTKSAIVWVSKNIHQTFTKSRVQILPDTLNTKLYESYASLKIKSKPNIYLIFIEAYGSVIGCVSPYDSLYFEQLKSVEANLYSNGWLASSALSNSTILGGRSWLGFTSLMAGIRIDNHPSYEKLISKYKEFPHLINTLNKFGYDTYRLNTMANYGDDFKTLDSVAGAFYNLNNKWTRHNDIPYTGYRYDYFGGIPDQFALNYWHDHELHKNKKPYFLFFITLNTHAPFYLPPPLLENWKDLNDIKNSPHKNVRVEKGKPIDRFSKEVNYILSTLEKFILEKADSNDIFILLGDHQPAGMEYMVQNKTDLYANPIHIITKDQKWITELINRGFEKGMIPLFKPNSLLNHEEFYSFFMNVWASRDSLEATLPVLKNGIK